MIWELRQYNVPYIVVRTKIGIEHTSMTYPLIVDCGRNFEGFFYDVENDFINYNTAPLNNKQIYHCYEVWFKFDITRVYVNWSFDRKALDIPIGPFTVKSGGHKHAVMHFCLL